MYTIRVCESDDDLKQVSSLWTLHTKLMRTKVKEIKFNLDAGTIVGAFDNDRLIGTMRHHDWVNTKMYSIDSIYVKPGEVSYYASLSGVKNPIVPLLDHIIAAREEQGHYTWFYTRAISPGYSRIHKRGHSFLGSSKLGSRYQKFLMEIVPPNERSVSPAHDALIGRRLFNVPVMVVMCCLKNEFRQTIKDLGAEAEYF